MAIISLVQVYVQRTNVYQDDVINEDRISEADSRPRDRVFEDIETTTS